MKKFLVLSAFLMIFFLMPVHSQDKQKNITVSGYASWLYSAIFDSLNGSWINSNMIHNRINLKAYTGKNFITSLEIRNRIVSGNMVSSNSFYADFLGSDPGWADLSWNIFSEKSFLFNTTIDRAYIEYNTGSFQFRAGRQRINWSQAMVWNPNDIFNTYSFFDFDYVERPGSDAVRMIYNPSASSCAEAVVKAEHNGRVSSAGLYRFSAGGFDIQFLGGELSEKTIVAGSGWSGAVGPYSIRGETSWFIPVKKNEEKSTFILTAGADRVFSDKISSVTQFMYCNNPVRISAFSDLYFGGMDARQLAFSKFTAMGQVTYTPMSLLNLTTSAIWYPDLKGLYAGPAVDFSLKENIDISLIWQFFHSTINDTTFRMNLAFIRFRYSF